MLGAEYVIHALRDEGIDHVFIGLGGLNDPFMPPLTGTAGLTPLVAAHEAGAAFMADGYARATGRFGVAFGIGGPGVLNMATAVASARADRSPLVVIGGEVPTSWEGLGAFQDASGAALDDDAVLKPITALSISVESPVLLDHHLRAAITSARAERSPVHLAVPRDVQQATVAGEWVPLPPHLDHAAPLDEGAARAFVDLLAGGRGEPPEIVVVLAGPGVTAGAASGELVAVAEAYGWPVATTLHAKGTMPEDHPLSLGVFGYAGTRHAIDAILADDVDVLVVLGSGLTQRDTLFWDRRMRPRQALVHVDVDARVIGRTWPTELAVVGDCGAFLRHLLHLDGEPRHRLQVTRAAREAWLAGIQTTGPRTFDPEHGQSEQVPLHPARVITALRQTAPRDTVLVPDSGAHRAWCGHYWDAYGPRDYITATNLGPMGAAVPLAIGAKVGRPDRPCVAVTGDGCMLMHGLELHTAVQHEVPIVVVVINNHAYGNIWFRAVKMGPGPEALTAIVDADWHAFARSLGAEAMSVRQPEELVPAFTEALASSRPVLVDVHCDKTANTPVTPWKEAAHEWEDDH